MLLEMGYGDFESALKHDHYTKPPFISLEMHRSLVPAERDTGLYYENIWDRVEPKHGYQYVYEMSKEEQYIFTMVHLAEHFKDGGVGIRFIMDVYVYNQRLKLNKAYINEEFRKLGLLEFAANVEKLAYYWFGEEDVRIAQSEKELLEELGEFIIGNGTYGRADHSKALALEAGGKRGYFRRVVFPELKSMETAFPWLKGRRFLLPVAWAVRIVRVVVFRRKNLRLGLDTIRNGDTEHGAYLKMFYKKCGL